MLPNSLRLMPGWSTKLVCLFDVGLVVAGYLLTVGSPAIATLGYDAFLMTSVWLLLATLGRVYDPSVLRPLSGLLARLLLATGGTALLLDLGSWLSPGRVHAPRPAAFFLVTGSMLIFLRALVAKRLHLDEAAKARAVVVGRASPELRRELAETHVIVGYLALPSDGRREVGWLGTADTLQAALIEYAVDEVFIADTRASPRDLGKAIDDTITVCERLGVPFALPTQVPQCSRARLVNHDLNASYAHYVTVEPKALQMAFKRLFDIAASAAALVLLSPLLVTVAALIKLTSRGPVLFRQNRVGLHGSRFRMLKFRSMVVDAEALRPRLEAQNEQTGPAFKLKHDPRVTRVGRFIRKYSIDELPQLVNILLGDMSVVGPRPALPSEVAKYEAWQRRRLSVRPGLTCIWQVSGRDQIGFEEWMHLDMRYVDEWNLWLDMSLIAATVPVVLTGRGAS